MQESFAPSRATAALTFARVVSFGLLSAVTVVAGLSACSSKKPNPPMSPTTSTDGGMDASAAGDGGLSMEAGVAAIASDAGPVSTGPTFFTGGDAGSSGGSTGPAPLTEQALDSAIDLAMTTAQPKVAPKMDKDGAPTHTTLKEGDHFPMMITLAPNRCYTIVALSLPGSVAQLDMKLYAPPLFNAESGKSSPSDKAMPVIGKGTAALCPLLPIAIPYKLDVAATKGAGRVGIQVYARNK